jgi:hypothetical protein
MEKSRASKAALENLLETEQLAYKNQQLIIEELANSNEPAHVIVDKRRAGVSTMEKETLTADLLAQVPSLRRLKQASTTIASLAPEDDVWITAPLDTVDPLPYAPDEEYVDRVLSTAHNIPYLLFVFSVDLLSTNKWLLEESR